MATATATRGRAPNPALAGLNDDQIKAWKKEEAQKKKDALPSYPVPSGGLTEVGADYSPSKFKKLDKSHFKAYHLYLDFSANLLEERFKRMRQEANDLRVLGDVKDTAKAKKLLKAKRDFEDLKKQLEASEVGIDIGALLSSLG